MNPRTMLAVLAVAAIGGIEPVRVRTIRDISGTRVPQPKRPAVDRTAARRDRKAKRSADRSRRGRR